MFLCLRRGRLDLWVVLTRTQARFPRGWERSTGRMECSRSFPSLSQGSPILRASRILSYCGSLIALRDSRYWVRRLRTIGRMGSSRRPNPIGLTTVELLRREGCELHVRGVDMLDGTPILDIKPLLSSIAAERLRRGWLAGAEQRQTR